VKHGTLTIMNDIEAEVLKLQLKQHKIDEETAWQNVRILEKHRVALENRIKELENEIETIRG